MDLSVVQLTNLTKVLPDTQFPIWNENTMTAMPGQRISYQIAMRSSYTMLVETAVSGDFADKVELFRAQLVPVDAPCVQMGHAPMGLDPEDYVSLEPCRIPDALVPMAELGNKTLLSPNNAVLWVSLDIPKDTAAGTYKYTVDLTFTDVRRSDAVFTVPCDMTLTVIPVVMPEQQTIYSRWFHADCVATAHHVEIFSEAHWELMEKYVAAAARVGMNMILTPIHTPPLDTAEGTARPCVQLVDIEKNGDTYTFNFDKLTRFVTMCLRHGITRFEMAHLFSQWGAKCPPNIMVTHDGVTDYLFGWHVSATGPEYTNFLPQYITAVCNHLKGLGVLDNCFFHISDEPNLHNIDQYRAAADLLRPLLGDGHTIDALSKTEFCEQGLVGRPCCVVQSVKKFLDAGITDLWTYYCCGPQTGYPNSFLAMQARNNRVLGFLLYRWNIGGFMQWGLNFYHSQLSYHPVDPWVTTSSEGSFPSGDAFILYPGHNTVYGSTRAEVMYDALQDVRICQALEQYIGRDAVCEILDTANGDTLEFGNFPKRDGFLIGLREKLLTRLAAEAAKK